VGVNIVHVISRTVLFRRRYLHVQMHLRIAACAVLAGVFSLPHLATATTVRMETNLGNIDIVLYDDQAPLNVANFLRYAGSGRYTNNGFIHRHAKKSNSGVSVIQGGGYEYYDYLPGMSIVRHIEVDPPVRNEFSPSRSNVRRTISMAKTANPDSATSEWFINYDDNSEALDNINNSGGFTVFGQVTTEGMNVVDAITNLVIQPSNLWVTPYQTQRFSSLPVINSFPETDLDLSNKLVMVTRIPNVTATKTLTGTTSVFSADVDMTFSPANALDKTTTASLLATLTTPANETVELNDGGILTFMVNGATCQTACTVALDTGDGFFSNRYYNYGPTPDNTVPHWYDFTYDPVTKTGAEFVNGKILLHFVDGQRGDDDLTTDTNHSITHTGISGLAISSIKIGTLSGATADFTTDIDMTFSSATALTTTESLLATFTQPTNKTIEFNSGGVLRFAMNGATCQTACTVTLVNSDGFPATYYYNYGPTPDNPAPHWYDFTYDGKTGAEFVNGKIRLHFVDGQRGDDDLNDKNGSVTHTGISGLAAPSIKIQTLSGATVEFTTNYGMTFSSAKPLDKTTTISLLSAFTQPTNKTILFDSGGILTFTVTGTKCQTACTVTLGNGSPSTHYYAYGPTPDNHTPHWYDFSYDSATGTGVEFVNGKILLHFIDGKRGDDDLTVNSSVTHTGISAVSMDSTTAQASSKAGGGCTITATPSQTTRNGDWIVISMFLAFVALVRRRALTK
jgi:cyclophilin family peptidyl-prolyl cis-trans isomerase